MRASVVVVTFNHAAIVGECLRAVLATVPEDVEIVVVDNASSDGTVDVVRREFPSVRVIESGANLGYGGGNNLGARHANGEFLVFLNPDARPCERWLEPLLAVFDDDPTVGLVTPKLLLARDPTLIDTLGNDVHLSGITPSRLWGEPSAAHTQTEEVSAISGACFALKRELFQQLGGFDERYFLYYEDTDLSLRARLAGYRCLAVPESEVVHDHRPGFPPAKLRYLERNRYWTLLKLFRAKTLLALLPTLLLAELVAWGMAFKSGLGHVLAKARSWLDLVAWLPGLPAARRAAHSARAVGDAELLPLHSTRLRFGQAADGPTLGLFERATSAAFWLTRLVPAVFIRDVGRASGGSADPTRRLKIAHVTATFPPYWGGTGNVAWHNAQELVRLGHEVHVFTAAPGADRGHAETADPEGVRVHRLRPLLRIGNAPLLPSLVTRLRGFDLIHLHYPFFFGAELVWLASRLFGVPYVITYHQDVLLPGHLRWVPLLHHRLVGRHVLAGARRLLFTTRDYGQASFAAALADGPAADVLPNAVDTRRFSRDVDGSSVRRALAASPTDVLVLFVAALDRAHHFKGLAVLLHALAALRAEGIEIRLLVVGEGDLRTAHEETAQRLGVAQHVHFAGRVSDAELPRYHGAADLLVLPSLTRGEAFGLVLLEAMAVGRPVIASDLPGVSAVVRETGGGVLVPPGDVEALAGALRRLAIDPRERAVLGSAGREAVQARYSWDAIGPRLDRMYRTVLARCR